jgi:hypothetical protein
MRLHVLSDLHVDLKHNDWQPDPVDCDVVVCAGDVRAPLSESLRWLRAYYPDSRIIYVPGNHDYYSEGDPKILRDRPWLKTTWERERGQAPAFAEALGIDLLDNRSIEIDGVRFLGSTLWTNFKLRPAHLGFHDAVRGATKSMNDYKLIKVSPGRSRDRLLPHDTIAAHNASVAWLKTALAVPFDGDTVVVTHHLPSRRSLPAPEALSETDCCYASSLEYLLERPDAPTLWIHGHVHKNQDYMIGSTRVLSNARGYPVHFRSAGAARENPDFDPELVVEVGYDCTQTMGM